MVTCTSGSPMSACPRRTCCWARARGFEISQLRLGQGRIHHCMRLIGAAELAIDLGKNMETLGRWRVEVEAMRLMVLKAVRAMDVLGSKEVRIWVGTIKAMVPEKAVKIIDDAMQVHGATGVSQWSPLLFMYATQRVLRLADGSDEVHHHTVARAEVQSYKPPTSVGNHPASPRTAEFSLVHKGAAGLR